MLRSIGKKFIAYMLTISIVCATLIPHKAQADVLGFILKFWSYNRPLWY